MCTTFPQRVTIQQVRFFILFVGALTAWALALCSAIIRIVTINNDLVDSA
jgi:hypothetical protein